LPFSYAVKNVNTIEWYLGSVDGKKPRKMLDNLPVCGNCHSFSAKQPLLAMDVDYGNDKGSYVIAKTVDTCHLTPENIITWSDYKREDNEPTFGLLSQISPDGNYVLSTVKDLSIFVAVDNNLAYSQLFFPIKGIIGIYDRKNNSFDALNGANDVKYVQSNPGWSPDGKKVVFAKTGAYVNEKAREAGKALLTLNDISEFSKGGKQFKYDLYTVDFNNGKGGVATPIEGASNNGKSNYFPKFSPDGKWIVFCQAENFMLLQRDSRLYIMPSTGGTPRLLNCNMKEMNSWHSWSPNSRWIVFSSKNRGLYTQLYLTHIDENGMDSPPVLLENLCFEKRAANIPEFYPFNGQHFKKITDNFSKTPQYFNLAAFDAMSNKYYRRAMDNLNNATKIDSYYLETYFNRMMLNILLKQSNSKKDIACKKKAMEIVSDSLRLKPWDKNYLSLKITLLSNTGRMEEAIEEAKLAIQKYPDNYKFYELLSSIYRKKNQGDQAIECYRKMMKINPREKFRLNNVIAETYLNLNQNDEALQIVNQYVKDRPDDCDLIYSRAQIFLNKKNPELAKKDIDYIVLKDSSNYNYNKLLTQYYLNQGNKRLGYLQITKNLQILHDLFNKNNEDVGVIFEITSLYMSLGDLKNSENWYNIILSYFPDNYEALKQKATIKLKMQLWNEAILIYDQLERNYPPEEQFFNNKAIVYIQTGNYSKALEYFNKTIELNPNNKDALFNRDKLKAEMAGRR
jgi:tetratricopeptide (TPR) repeat protein